MPIAKFVNNNAQNINTGYIPFKLNYKYHLNIFFKEIINLYFYLKITNKLTLEFEKLWVINYENIYQNQEPQRQTHNKDTKI